MIAPSLRRFSTVFVVAVSFGLGSAGAFAQAEIATLAPDDLADFDGLGKIVDVAADTAIVGSSAADLAAGRVIVADVGDEGWAISGALTPLALEAGAQFGRHAELGELATRAIVGAYLHDAAGVDAGLAFVFERDDATTPEDPFDDTWPQVAQLAADDAAPGDWFGWTVALSFDVALVGAPKASGGGAAYVFERDDLGVWNQVQRLNASAPTPLSQFGWSVSIRGDTLVVGDNADNTAFADGGAAYVFVRDGEAWIETQRLMPSTLNEGLAFGSDIELCRNQEVLVIGAQGDTEGANASGATFVFDRSDEGTPADPTDDTWSESAKLKQPTPEDTALFGNSVSISLDGNRALIGAPYLPFSSPPDGGRAYLFERSATANWTLIATLASLSGTLGDSFGDSVAIDANHGVVGTPGADLVAQNGGAASVFELPFPATEPCLVQRVAPPDLGPGGDAFAQAVDVDGDVAVVGAWLQGLAGVGNATGAAYVYERTGTGWTQTTQLLESAPEPVNEFGWSVAVHGDTILVGAILGEGIDPDTGAVTVFDRNPAAADGAPDAWIETARLGPAAGGSGVERFGSAVALGRDTAVVGANGTSPSGAVHVFQRDRAGTPADPTDDDWIEIQRIEPFDWDFAERFGTAVAISGDANTIVVGDERDAFNCCAEAGAGAVTVYVRDHNGTPADGTDDLFVEADRLFASDPLPFAEFGLSVDLSDFGDTVVVGSPFSSAPGAFYVFERDFNDTFDDATDDTWFETLRAAPTDLDASSGFGHSVALVGNRIVAGAPFASVDGVVNAGAAFVFARSCASWVELGRLLPKDPTAGASFGTAVAAEGGTAWIGAPSSAGYVFDLDLEDPWEDLGGALPGTGGVPTLAGWGCLRRAQPLTLRVSGALPGAAAFLVVGADADNVPFQGGLLVPSPDVVVAGLAVSEDGTLVVESSWPGDAPAGTSFVTQAWIVDAGGVEGFAATNATRATSP